jgi:hypothetical protein
MQPEEGASHTGAASDRVANGDTITPRQLEQEVVQRQRLAAAEVDGHAELPLIEGVVAVLIDSDGSAGRARARMITSEASTWSARKSILSWPTLKSSMMSCTPPLTIRLSSRDWNRKVSASPLPARPNHEGRRSTGPRYFTSTVSARAVVATNQKMKASRRISCLPLYYCHPGESRIIVPSVELPRRRLSPNENTLPVTPMRLPEMKFPLDLAVEPALALSRSIQKCATFRISAELTSLLTRKLRQ